MMIIYVGLIIFAMVISITVFCHMTRMNRKQMMVALTMGLAVLYIYFHNSFYIVSPGIGEIFKISAPVFVVGYILLIVLKDKISKSDHFVVFTNKDAPNPLFEKTVKKKIETLLTKKEYRLAPSEKAKFIIRFYYTIGPSDAVDEPGDAERVHPFQSGSYDVYGRRGGYFWEDPFTKGKAPSFHTQSSARGQSYTRMCLIKILDAASFRATGKEDIVWMADVTNVGKSPELQKDIDYLLAALFKYFAKDTRMRIRTLLSSSNKEVQELRGSRG